MANKVKQVHWATFEKLIQDDFKKRGAVLNRPFKLNIGAGANKKPHKYDLGATDPPIIIECKSHSWTKSGNVPSAKMSVWIEAMYYFKLAPRKFRKILNVRRSISNKGSLTQYFIRRYKHLVPADVEIWEYNMNSGRNVKIY